MATRSWLSLSRSAGGWVGLRVRRVARAWMRVERPVVEYITKTTPRRRASRVAGVALFGFMTICFMGPSGCESCLLSLGAPPAVAQLLDELAEIFFAVPHVTQSGGAAEPRFTGTNGSQTGVASFAGNFTGISEPSGSYFVMARMADCSLAQLTGTATNGGATGTATGTSAITNYERTLHQLAGLTTTTDVFAQGCKDPTIGMSTRIGVMLERQASGPLVMATVQGYLGNNAVFILSTKTDFSTGGFSPLPGTTAASAITTADLNGDSNGDLVVVNDYNAASSYVSVLISNGDGTFKTPVNYPIAGNASVAAVIDDVNGDGKLDIVAVSDTQQISVLLGNGNGTFQAATSFAAPTLPGYTSNASTPILGLITADVNGDGKKDIVCSNGAVLLGSGTGTFTAVSAPAFPFTSANPGGFGPEMAAGDINNDGKMDLVVDTGTTIYTYLGNGTGAFAAGMRYASVNNSGYVTLTDLDGDGNLDIYTGLANGGLFSGDDTANAAAYVLMGHGDGTFAGAAQATGGYNGTNLGDVNGDGIPDIITQGASGAFTVQVGDGKGGFTTKGTITAPASFTLSGYTFTTAATTAAATYAVGDINGDGKADLVWVDNNLTTTNPGGLGIQYPYPIYFVAISNGDGTFQTPVAYAFPQIAPAADFDNTLTVSGLAIADFRNNGKNDLIFSYNETAGTGSGQPAVNPYNQGIGVLLGNGNGTFGTTPVLTSTYSSNTAPTTASVAQILSATDLNGDNKPDLIVNAPGTTIVNFQLQSLLEVYVGNGDGTFQAPTTLTSADEYGLPVVADFNKDGKMDLAWLAETSASQAELVVALGNGNGTFGTPAVTNLTGGDAIRSAALAGADFDGDGKVDLMLLDANDYSGVFYGKGDGTFTSVPGVGYVVPKDLINIAATNGGTAVAVKMTSDGRTDVMAGTTVLLNLYGAAPVIPATTTVGLTSTATTIAPGGSVKFTATITPAVGSTANPTGTVTFYNGSTSIGTGTVSAGVATLTTSALTTVGTDTISAIYGGDTNFSGSPSGAVSLTVTSATLSTPTVTVTPGASSVTTAQSLMVTVSVSGGNGNPTPTGSVTLSSTGYTSAATALVSGSAQITVPAGSLAVGLDSLTAQYTPDANSSSTYNSAMGGNTVTVTAALITVPNVVGLTQAAAASAITGAGLTLGTVTTAASATVAAGSVVSQNPLAGASAAPASGVSLVVSTGPGVVGTVTSLSAIQTTSGDVTTVVFTVGVSATSGTAIPTGNVSLTDGGTIIATLPIGTNAPPLSAGGITVFTINTLTPGMHNIAASYPGAAGAFQASVSATDVFNIPLIPWLTLTPGSTSLSFAPGATTGNSTVITVTPVGGFTGSVTLTAGVTQSPTGATDPPVPSFGATSPVSITGTGTGSGTLTVSTTAPGSGALVLPKRPGSRDYETGGVVLAGLLLLVIPRRRAGLRLLGLLVCAAALGSGLIGCGGGGNSGNKVSSNSGTTPGNYTILVTAAGPNVITTTTVTVTVQ